MADRPKLAGHVRIGDHELLVDGEPFPWYVAPDVTVTDTGHPGVPWFVNVEILPILAGGTGPVLDITCHGDRSSPVIGDRPFPWFVSKESSPVIGDRPFPWFVSKDGYQVVGAKPCPVLKLAFLAEQVEDARTP
ncbi:hypothetical protein AO501_25230 [Mycobacterium gordonae]|uniref:Uncharacterized protein n=1 Tax=Mycobacterium gordonae TaxID=1778 RepID=A0A0Q2M6S4_MYCGO|nr:MULTISPECIES: hypothetical protein [Mycobacterium]KQH75583.1 hypothetical protein AO501_25230 [Mycobacterium gordonae]MDP7732101.1 hypothetical protein [Mycobacterium sp. TY813]